MMDSRLIENSFDDFERLVFIIWARIAGFIPELSQI